MKVDPKSAVVELVSLGFGIHYYMLRGRESNMPIASAWITASLTGQEPNQIGYAEIVDLYVPCWCRRQGSMRVLLDELRKSYPTLRTDSATADGLLFLQSYGFKEVAGLGWIYQTRDEGDDMSDDMNKAWEEFGEWVRWMHQNFPESLPRDAVESSKLYQSFCTWHKKQNDEIRDQIDEVLEKKR